MAHNDFDAYLKGVSGEDKIARILSRLDKDEYIVINNVLLKRPYARMGEVPTAQIDHIVVSVYGIFTVETKNYSGKIYGYESSKTWSVYMGGKKYTFVNPLRQNHGHSKTIQQLISYKSTALGLSRTCFDIYPIIAFSDGADLSKVQTSGVDVVYFSDVLSAIKNKSKARCLDFTQVKAIADYISELNIYSPDNIAKHINDIKRLKGDDLQEKSWNVTVGSKKHAENWTKNTEIVEPKIESNYSSRDNRESFVNSYNSNKTQKTIFEENNIQKNTIVPNNKKKTSIVPVIFLALALVIVISFLFCCGGSIITNSFMKILNAGNNASSVSNINSYNIKLDEEEIPPEKNITVQDKIYQPRTDVINDILYICRGGYYDLDPHYVDEDGNTHTGLINMWCHFAFTDGTYIDINAKSYNELSFEYFASTNNWSNNEVTIQVYDLDTNQMIYETDKFEQGHTKTATVDISDCENIRLKFVDANDGICYCCIDNIILKQ